MEMVTYAWLIRECHLCFTALPCNLAEALRRLWEDGGIQECYGRRIEYGLTEGSQHFVTNINRITMPGYVPSQEDYLCIKTPSKGMLHRWLLTEFPRQLMKKPSRTCYLNRYHYLLFTNGWQMVESL